MRSALAATAAWVVASLVLTLLPEPGHLAFGLGGRPGHVVLGIMFGGSAFCLTRALWLPSVPRALFGRAVSTWAVGAGFLVATELLQGLVPTRQSEVGDAVADLGGLAAAVVGLTVAFTLRPSRAVQTTHRFAALAVLTAGLAVTTVLVVPPAVHGPNWPVEPGASDDCVERFVELPPAPASETARPEGAATTPAEPLVQVDLAADPSRSSGRGDPLVLRAEAGTAWEPGVGVVFREPSDAVRSTGPATDLVSTLAAERAFTIAAWFRPGDLDQEGPTRLVSLSDGTEREAIDVQLGVQLDRFSIRVRTACQPLWFLAGRLTTAATHAAVTYQDGLLTAYVDGAPVAEARLVDGDLSVWNPSDPLSIGNEVTLDRAFRGTISLVTIDDRALDADEVAALAGDATRRAALDGGLSEARGGT